MFAADAAVIFEELVNMIALYFYHYKIISLNLTNDMNM